MEQLLTWWLTTDSAVVLRTVSAAEGDNASIAGREVAMLQGSRASPCSLVTFYQQQHKARRAERQGRRDRYDGNFNRDIGGRRRFQRAEIIING